MKFNKKVQAVILAAGAGTRMRSSIPKVLHKIGGIPLIVHVLKLARSVSSEDVIIVYKDFLDEMKEVCGDNGIKWVLQEEQLGTGHAVSCVLNFLGNDSKVIVLCGDVPLISSETLLKLIQDTPEKSLGMLLSRVSAPKEFGRVVLNSDGNIVRIVEDMEASEEEKEINLINIGVYFSNSSFFKEAIPKIENKNKKEEYYLTDIVDFANKSGVKINGSYVLNPYECLAVNDKLQLSDLDEIYQLNLARKLASEGGVIFQNMKTVYFQGSTEIDRDVLISPNVSLHDVKIGEGSTIGDNCVLKNVDIGKNVTIHPHSFVCGAVISDNCEVGPFARIRPKTELFSNVKIGNFVEVKNSKIMNNSKINHLSYVGDAEVGNNVNIGAGTVTCNYDGRHKYKTKICDNAFIGSNVAVVAPVKIGVSAFIAAGSTITKDAPDNKLTVARSRQVTLYNWKAKDKK